MMTRQNLITGLKCYGCNDDLKESELKYYYDYDGMCENCFTSSMSAAFEDEWLEEKDRIGLIDDED